MKFKTGIWTIVMILFIAGCGVPKVLTSYKDNAEKAALQGNFVQAVEAWKQYFNQHPVEETKGLVFAEAAQNAFQAGENMLAADWFDQARYKDFSSPEMYAALAKIYRLEKNLSKELTALEFYTSHFTEVPDEIYSRLFEIYDEIDMDDKALSVWGKLDEASKSTVPHLDAYFQINLKRENKEVCDSVSLVLLDKDPKNVDALEWNAQKYYLKAESLYEEQMEKYNQNKTTKQYRILLKQLDQVTADFKMALPYFEKLWEINPGEKYAGYLANIYARFNNEKKSDYYKKFLK
jgi:tetratricopeptide (TPR) repeat protein